MIWIILQEYRLYNLVSKVKFTWRKVQDSRIMVILPLITSRFFLILRKMSMNKDIRKNLFLLLRVSQKALQLILILSLIFFFFFFSVFLNRLIKVFFVHLIVVACTCRSILGHTWEKVCGKCSIDLKLLCENITCHVL